MDPFASVLLPGTVEIRRCFGFGERCMRFQADGQSDVRPEGVVKCIIFANRDNAIDYLRQFVLNVDVTSRLRSLLGEESFNVWRLSDHQVVEQIAMRLAQRTLCVVPPATRAVAMTSASGLSKRAIEYHSNAQSPSAVAVLAHAQTPQIQPPSKLPEMNPLDEVDHDKQAATLEAASRDGLPFCEACEKARFKRSTAGAS